MKLKGIHTILRGMSLCEFKRDYMMLKGIHMILKGMSLFEFKGDPSIPTKPARKKKKVRGSRLFILYGIRAAAGLPPLKFDCLASVQKHFIRKFQLWGWPGD